MTTAIILGAGASRGVSYSGIAPTPSPLDADFFELLKELHDPADFPEKDPEKVNRVLEWRHELSKESKNSFERAFYTLQTKASLLENFTSKLETKPTDDEVVSAFATCINALLRKAHGTLTCQHHQRLFETLEDSDTIISFNYDLVAERALKMRAERDGIAFGPWLYALEGRTNSAKNFPMLLKLHGSSNWSLVGDRKKERISVNTEEWSDFDSHPGYRGYRGTGTRMPIFLPFWDKRIEKGPWLVLWRSAYERLRLVEKVIVWGYSLPTTDIKAQLLFALALGDRSFRLCVTDPSVRTRRRWRSLFPNAIFCAHKRISAGRGIHATS